MMIFSKLIQNLSKFIEKLSKYIQNLFDKFSLKIQSGWADPSWWGLCLITWVSPQGPSTLSFFSENSHFSEQKMSFWSTGIISGPFWVWLPDPGKNVSKLIQKSFQIYWKTVQIYSYSVPNYFSTLIQVDKFSWKIQSGWADPSDEAFASSLGYLLKALPLGVFQWKRTI